MTARHLLAPRGPIRTIVHPIQAFGIDPSTPVQPSTVADPSQTATQAVDGDLSPCDACHDDTPVHQLTRVLNVGFVCWPCVIAIGEVGA